MRFRSMRPPASAGIPWRPALAAAELQYLTGPVERREVRNAPVVDRVDHEAQRLRRLVGAWCNAGPSGQAADEHDVPVLPGRRGFGCQCFEAGDLRRRLRSEEHTSELQSLMRISYAVFCLKNKTN